MPSERMQRQIDRLLDEAEKAASEKDWAHVADCGREVLAVDAGNEDAVAFFSMAERYTPRLLDQIGKASCRSAWSGAPPPARWR
jgi:hypothetical protein